MESTTPIYPLDGTALLFVDPYNDLLSHGGKSWRQLADVAGEVDLIANLRRIREAFRCASWPMFIVPHRRAEKDELDAWKFPTPHQRLGSEAQLFAKGNWGGEWHPDFAPRQGDTVAKEHFGASGFANTDLDFLLRQNGISHVIVIGVVANTCVEATSRHASELGYHVTLVRDATSAFSTEAMRCAHAINGPTYAHAILSTRELLAGLPFISAP